MFKVMGFLTKKDDIATAEFVRYYEDHHVPLILSLAPAPITYVRHYVHREEGGAGVTSPDFDVVTEMEFVDQAAYDAWLKAVTTAGEGKLVAEDEARFLDRSRTLSSVIEDRTTETPSEGSG